MLPLFELQTCMIYKRRRTIEGVAIQIKTHLPQVV